MSLGCSRHRQTRGEDDAANLRIEASSKSEEGWAVSGNPGIFEIGVKEIGEAPGPIFDSSVNRLSPILEGVSDQVRPRKSV